MGSLVNHFCKIHWPTQRGIPPPLARQWPPCDIGIDHFPINVLKFHVFFLDNKSFIPFEYNLCIRILMYFKRKINM